MDVWDKLIGYHERKKQAALRDFKSLGKLRHTTKDEVLHARLMQSDKQRYKFHKQGLEALRKVKGEQDI